MQEAYSIAKLDHPNIVGVHHVFEDNQTAYMALDLVNGRDLIDVMNDPNTRLSPQQIREMLIKLLDAVDTIHSQDMLHRDISPDNILLNDDGNPVLIDFGCAREEVSKKSRALSAMLVVKDGYSPQEFYIAGSKQLACSDLYSLAATFYQLIADEAPPNSQVRLLAKGRSEADPYQPLSGRIVGYPPVFLEVLDKAMELFPADRVQTAKEWMARIDPLKKREIALAHAKTDGGIEKSVQQLLEVTQKEPRPVPRRAADIPKQRRRPVPHERVEPAKPHPFPELASLPDENYVYREDAPELPPQPPRRMVPEPKPKARSGHLARALSVLVIAGAVSLYMSDDAKAMLTELGGPYVSQVISSLSEHLAALGERA